MPVAPAVLIGALIYSLLSLVKYVRAGNANGAVTILTGYVIGVGVMFLASVTETVGTFEFNGHAINDLGAGDKVFYGLLATSLFSAFHDIKKAVDGTDSAVVPKLLPDSSPQD